MEELDLDNVGGVDGLGFSDDGRTKTGAKTLSFVAAVGFDKTEGLGERRKGELVDSLVTPRVSSDPSLSESEFRA